MAISKVTFNPAISSTPPVAASSSHGGSKNIQNQIISKQQHLNQLSSDTKLSATEKEEKRREIQKEIEELNRKLELLRMKQEEDTAKAQKKQEKEITLKEEQLEKQSSKEPLKDNSSKVSEDKKEPVNMSVKDIHKILSSDALLQMERVQETVANQKESTENILEAEIKMDELHGTDTTSKKAELSDLRQKENFMTEPTEQPKEQMPSGMHMDAHVTISI